jgi:hypothetical protein
VPRYALRARDRERCLVKRYVPRTYVRPSHVPEQCLATRCVPVRTSHVSMCLSGASLRVTRYVPVSLRGASLRVTCLVRTSHVPVPVRTSHVSVCLSGASLSVRDRVPERCLVKRYVPRTSHVSVCLSGGSLRVTRYVPGATEALG